MGISSFDSIFGVYEIDQRLNKKNNIDLEDNTSTPSQFFNYDELFSFSIDNSNYQVLSLFNEKGAEISIDHTNYLLPRLHVYLVHTQIIGVSIYSFTELSHQRKSRPVMSKNTGESSIDRTPA